MMSPSSPDVMVPELSLSCCRSTLGRGRRWIRRVVLLDQERITKQRHRERERYGLKQDNNGITYE